MFSFVKTLGAAVLVSAVALPASVQAFGLPAIDQSNIAPGGVSLGCNFTAFNDPDNSYGFFQSADVTLFNSSAPGFESAGGNSWFFGNIDSSGYDAITVADIESQCSQLQTGTVAIISDNGADAASYAAEDYIGITFTATPVGETQSYTYTIALQGASTTTVVATRVVNNTPNQDPIANAGSNVSVQSGNLVVLDGSASNDTDGSISSYAWSRTGGTGPNVVLTSPNSPNPSFLDGSLDSNSSSVTHIFSLVVTDNEGASSVADTVTITITPPPNAAPTVSASASATTVTSGDQVSLLANGNDTDGNIAAYSWSRTGGTGSVGNATLSSATAQNPTFTDSSLNVGGDAVTHVFSVTATDNDGAASAADTVTITIVAPSNTAPTAVAGATPSTAAAGQTVTLSSTGSTANDTGQTLNYTWSQTAGTTVTLSSTSAAAPTFTAPTLVPGVPPETLTFSLVVNDGVENSAASLIDVTVNPPANVDPTADAGPDQTVASSASVTLDGTASDPKNAGQSLTYAWSQTAGSEVLSSIATAAQPTFTAPSLAIGAADETLVFSLIVNDGMSSSVADTVSVTVEAPMNTAPTANAGPDQTIASAATVTLDGSVSNAEDSGQTLTYSWSQVGLGSSVILTGANTVKPTFTAPTLAIGAPDQTLTFQLSVFDGFDTSAVDTVVVTVEPPANTAPVAKSGADKIVTPNATVSLDGTGSSANDVGQTLTYAWTQTGGTPASLSSTTVPSPSFTTENLVIGDMDSVLTFSLIVNDGVEDSVPSSVTITVDAPENALPTASAGADQTVAPNALVTLNGTLSAANDGGQTLTYAWTQPGGTSVPLSSMTAVSPTFTAPNLVIGDSDAVLTFNLTVNDGFDTSVADTAIITVTAPLNTLPTADGGSDQTVANGTLVTLDSRASAANDNGQVLTYAWTQKGGTTVNFDATAAQPTFTAPTLNIGDADVVLTFSLTVNDGFDTSAANDVVVTVSAPADVTAPVITSPANIAAEAGPGGTASVAFTATVADNFDTVVSPVFSLSGEVINSPFDFAVGVNTVLVNATDAADNMATQQSFVVTVSAATAPAAPLIVTSVINANRSLTIAGTAEADATVKVTFPDSSMQSVTAKGGTYSVTSAADMTGGTVSVTATDAVGNPSAAATVDLFPDFGRPTVAVSGAPATIIDATPFTITITFSEAVTGFVQGDLRVTGADITSFAGSGAVYTAEITPLGTEAVTIAVAEGVAQDDFGNLNDASQLASISLGAMTANEKLITQTAQQRNMQLIRSQPNINRFLLGGLNGRFNINATQGAGNFDMGTSSDRPVWLLAQGQWSTQDNAESSYANLSLGSHYELTEDFLIGAMAQFDTLTSDDGPMSLESHGWLVGPYAVARLPEQKLVFSGAYLAGQSDNTFSPLGTYEDTFTSDRTVLTLDVAGEVAFERFMLIPVLDFARVTDQNEAYVGGDGFDVRSMTVTMTDATFGLDFVVPVQVSDGALDLLGGFGATASVYDDGVTRSESSRGGVSMGARYAFGAANQLSLTARYDGIGDDDYEAFGASARIEFNF